MKIFYNLDNLNKKTVVITEEQARLFKEQIAYHGSKADFEQFSCAYIGTGIGAQEFGEGIYLTFDKEAAMHYGGVVYTVDIPDVQTNNYIFYDQPIEKDCFERIIDGIINYVRYDDPEYYDDETNLNDFKNELYEVLNPSEGRYLMYNIHRYIDDKVAIPNILNNAGVIGFIYNNGKVDNVVMFSSKKIKIIEKENIDLNESQNIALLNEAELKDIYQKYYNNIPEETFWQIVKADPTYDPQKEQKMGKYGKWLLNLFKQNKLKLEDLYKATEYLQYFVKYYNKIQEKDINKYDSLPTLYNTIKQFKDAAENGEELATSKSDEIRKIKEDAEKFYEDDTWLVVIPHTEEAACYYGKNTEWCTAATNSYNMFEQYYDQGLLYINICKSTNKKYQFHFETCQFMDENDNPINVPIVSNIPLTQGLIQKYYQKYGGKATILLTTPVDLTNDFDDLIIGQEPYYSYVDYDGNSPIVKVNSGKIEYIASDLTIDNNVGYAGGTTFFWNDVNEEDYNSDTYDPDDNLTVFFNAETRQMTDGNFNRVSPINKNYTQYRNGDNNESLEVIDINTMETVFSNPTGAIENISKYLRWTDGWAAYDDNIVYFRDHKQTDKWGGGKYQTLKIEMFYNLATKQYIYPKQFGEYQWEIGRKLLDDNKYYLTFRSKYATSDGKVPYVIMYPDGSLSEVITESKKSNGKTINETHHSYDDGLQDTAINIAKQLLDKPDLFLTRKQMMIDNINVLLVKGNVCSYDSSYNNLQIGEERFNQCVEENDLRRLSSIIYHELGHKTNYEKSGNNYNQLKKDFETPLFLKLSDEEYKSALNMIYRFQTRELKARCFEATMFLKQSDTLPSLDEFYNDRCTDINGMKKFIDKLTNITQDDKESEMIKELYFKIADKNRFRDNSEWDKKYNVVLNWFIKQFNWFKKRIDKIYFDFKTNNVTNEEKQKIINETISDYLNESYIKRQSGQFTVVKGDNEAHSINGLEKYSGNLYDVAMYDSPIKTFCVFSIGKGTNSFVCCKLLYDKEYGTWLGFEPIKSQDVPSQIKKDLKRHFINQ